MRPIKRLMPGLLVGLMLAIAAIILCCGGPAGPQGFVTPAAAATGGADQLSKPGAETKDGHGHEGGHTEVFTVFLFGLAFVVIAAMVGRWLADLFHQPAVLGE